MKRSHLVLLLALSAPLALIAAAIAAYSVSAARATMLEDKFNAIPENASRETVVQALGKPDVIRKCGPNLWWGDDTKYRGANDGRCVTEERDEFFLTAYGIGYSSDWKAVSKYRYISE
jgi:hypothetical protein